MSDKTKVENIYTQITPEKEQKASTFLPSYIKSCSETRFEMISFDYSWKIEEFKRFSECADTLESPSFPANGHYRIKMNVLRKDNALNTIQFYIRTDAEFTGSCTTTLNHPTNICLSSKGISGRIKDMTLLTEFAIYNYQFECEGTLIIRCKIEIFHKLINNTIHMNLTPSSTIYKDVISDEDSIPESEFKNEKSIKFILGEEQFIISKKLLYATNSDYFKDICLTHKGKEKDMTNDFTTSDEFLTFKQMLFFILTGSIHQFDDYNVFKKLLITADKYDVTTLKLKCEHHLLRSITIENAVELILLAFACNAKLLETHSATVIKFHIKEIMGTKEFQSLSQKDSNKIMELIEEKEVLESCTYISSLKLNLSSLPFF